MSEVALQIGGRTYRVACAPGEEQRVTRLGAAISEKLASIGNPSGPSSQNLLLAALLLADEVHDARDGAAPSASAPSADADSEAKSDRIEALEARIGELEAELSRKEQREQASIGELADARARETELSRSISGHEDEKAELRARIAEFEQAAAVRDPSPSGAKGSADLSALAPALEHFAEMLEECADKLESRAAKP